MFSKSGNTPFGWLTVFSDGASVTSIEWENKNNNDNADDVSRETWRQIEAYCDGALKAFEVPLAQPQTNAMKNWIDTLVNVGFGEVITYKDLAKRAGHPKAPRAAGTTCSTNKIPLIIPCHRIVKIDGSLGNFGVLKWLKPSDKRNIAIKQALLDHEARYA